MEKKDTLKVQETVSRIPEGLADAKDAEQKGITGEKGSAAKGGGLRSRRRTRMRVQKH